MSNQFVGTAELRVKSESVQAAWKNDYTFSLKKLRHDLKNVVDVIVYLSKKTPERALEMADKMTAVLKEIEECGSRETQEQCRQYTQWIHRITEYIGLHGHLDESHLLYDIRIDFCENQVINAVLQEKAMECNRRGIGLHTNIYMSPTNMIDDVTLCSVLSNLLDNAISGVSKRLMETKNREEAWIWLTVSEKNSYLIIRTKNPAEAEAQESDGLQKKGNKGMGKHILTYFSESYSGAYLTNYENNEFTATAMLYMGDSF